MTEEQIESVVKATIRTMGEGHYCPLSDVGISSDEHKTHHRQWRELLADVKKFRMAFLLGIATAASGGLITLLWYGVLRKLGQ
jgi:hypothetical protein